MQLDTGDKQLLAQLEADAEARSEGELSLPRRESSSLSLPEPAGRASEAVGVARPENEEAPLPKEDEAPPKEEAPAEPDAVQKTQTSEPGVEPEDEP